LLQDSVFLPARDEGRGVKSVGGTDVMSIIPNTIRWDHARPDSFVIEIGATTLPR